MLMYEEYDKDERGCSSGQDQSIHMGVGFTKR